MCVPWRFQRRVTRRGGRMKRSIVSRSMREIRPSSSKLELHWGQSTRPCSSKSSGNIGISSHGNKRICPGSIRRCHFTGYMLICIISPSSKRSRPSRRRRAIQSEEVDKLLGANEIQELLFPMWLANIVLVPKPNRTWRMCVDFTSINKACPKDCYPLPNIDRLVDSSAWYKVVDFVDAFRGYDQIFMAEEDVENTAFVTEYGVYC
ncbi:hypothetical protein LIER_13532 [Lithospermum erythrorhizon]|uniref:Uncharacterized protein n=1 Tax=Lithospermum erythrorhizon TaxID=34254 RepID=A0AAV3PYZ9_LITER